MTAWLSAHWHYELIITAWLVVGGVVGAAVGWWRNRLWAGLMLGALLGPIGWLITAGLRARFIECPACSRAVRVQAAVCGHCGASLRRELSRSGRSTLRGTMRSGQPW